MLQKNFDILIQQSSDFTFDKSYCNGSLNNYFDDLTKLFSNLYIDKFFDFIF